MKFYVGQVIVTKREGNKIFGSSISEIRTEGDLLIIHGVHGELDLFNKCLANPKDGEFLFEKVYLADKLIRQRKSVLGSSKGWEDCKEDIIHNSEK